jgi:adenosylhomocysteine nucleosidase
MTTILILISADSEWQAVRDFYLDQSRQRTPYGEYFEITQPDRSLVFFQGGWGKISAAAGTQYAILRWKPDLLINIGTCGGLQGRIERGQIVLVERSLVYDIVEQMGDAQQALDFYTVDLDLSWLKEPYPQEILRGLLLSADRDILSADIPWLVEKFGAVAADWESGAIAWVCRRNGQRCLILRGVSDLVSTQGGEAYGGIELFQQTSQKMVACILTHLPGWLNCAGV